MSRSEGDFLNRFLEAYARTGLRPVRNNQDKAEKEEQRAEQMFMLPTPPFSFVCVHVSLWEAGCGRTIRSHPLAIASPRQANALQRW